MRHGLLLLLPLILLSQAPAFPATAGTRYFELSLSGNWEEEGDIEQRMDLRLGDGLSGLSLRALLVDRGPPTEEYRKEAFTALGAGLYHSGTGSRILLGPLRESGLAARIRRPLSKGLPYAEHHQVGIGELHPDAGPGTPNGAYVLAGTMVDAPIRVFGAATLTEADTISAEFGLQFKSADRVEATAAGTYIIHDMDEYSPPAWFSDQTSLPERKLHLAGARLVFARRPLFLAGDLAYSLAENQGEGSYGNLALGLHGRPLSVKLCAESTSDLFMDPEGNSTARSYRFGAKIEARPTRLREITLEGSIISPSPVGPVTGTAATVAYRAAEPIGVRIPAITAARLSAERDRSSKLTSEDGLSGFATLRWSRLRLSAFGSAQFARPLLPGLENPSALPLSGGGLRPTEISLGGAAFFRLDALHIGGRLERTTEPLTDPSWLASVRISVQGKAGKISITLTLPSERKPWILGLAWRKSMRVSTSETPTRTP